MQYRRANVPGACYFFTVNIAERNQSLLIDHVDELRLRLKKPDKIMCLILLRLLFYRIICIPCGNFLTMMQIIQCDGI